MGGFYLLQLVLLCLLAVVKISEQSKITLRNLDESSEGSNRADLDKRLVDMLDKRNEAVFNDLKRRRQFNRAFLRVNHDQILFKLYRQNINESYNILANDPKNLQSAPFDKNIKTAVVIHGWMNNGEAEFPTLMKEKICYEALLQDRDMNLIVVDWGRYSMNVLYPKSVLMTTEVGQIVGDVVSDLINQTYVDRSSLHIIGHSLGAHIAGFAGKRIYKNIGKKIMWVTGLDPALPLFDNATSDGRLDSSDANYVDIIHTCASVFGYVNPIGHIDFYPNGGVQPQPGCSLLSVGVCAHSRAWKYYAEALITPNSFVGYPCSDEDTFRDGKCTDLKNAKRMGELYPGGRSYGKYFLETKEKFPYHIEDVKSKN